MDVLILNCYYYYYYYYYYYLNDFTDPIQVNVNVKVNVVTFAISIRQSRFLCPHATLLPTKQLLVVARKIALRYKVTADYVATQSVPYNTERLEIQDVLEADLFNLKRNWDKMKPFKCTYQPSQQLGFIEWISNDWALTRPKNGSPSTTPDGI